MSVDVPVELALRILVQVVLFLPAFAGGLYAYKRIARLVDETIAATGEPAPANTLRVVTRAARVQGGPRWVAQYLFCMFVVAWVVWSSIFMITS